MEIKTLFESLNDIDALQKLIDDEIRECDTIEYKKACDKFDNKAKNEIAKDVSAMANSSGGIIVYGIETDPDDKTKPVKISFIHNSNIETFDRIVNSQIRREVTGIQKAVAGGTDKCMVVYIPQSDESPHQALVDNKYYRRSLAESRPMEHDLIELHFGKRRSPSLKLEVEIINPQPIVFNDEDDFSNEIQLRLFVSNTGKKVGKFVKVMLYFPGADCLKLRDVHAKLKNIDNLYTHIGIQAREYYSGYDVYHPEMRINVADIGLKFRKSWYQTQRASNAIIDWVIFADEMSKKTGLYFVDRIG